MKILVTALTTLVFCGLASGTANTIIPASSSETIPTPIRSIPIPTSVSVPPQTQPVAAIADKPLITPTSSTSSTPSTSSTSSTSLTPSTTSTTPTSSTTSPTTIPNTSLPPSFGENTRYSIYDTPAGSGIVISNTIDNDKLKPLDISKLSELMKSTSKKLDLPEDAVEKSIAAYLETLSVMADAAVYVREHVGTPQFYGEQPAESDFSSSNPSSVPTSAFTLSPSPSRDNYYYYPMRMVDSSNRNVFNIAALSSQHAEQLLFNTLSNAIGLRPTNDNYIGKIIDAHSDESIPSPNANPNLQAQPRLMTTASMNADPYYPPFDQPYLFRYPRSIRLGGLRPIDMASIINNSRATPATPASNNVTPTPTTIDTSTVASTSAPTAVPSTLATSGTSTTDTTTDATSAPDVTNTGNNTGDTNRNNISTPTPNADSSTSLTPVPSGPDAPPLTAEDLLSFSNPILIDSYDPSNPSRMNVHPRGLYPEFYRDYIAAAIAANKEKEARANAANPANPANAENTENTENAENATNGGNAATTAPTAITSTTGTPPTTATSTTSTTTAANGNTAEDAENPEDDDHNDCDEKDKNEENDDHNDSDDSDDDSDSDCESNNNNRFERRSNERPFGSTMSTRRVFTLRNTYPALSRYSNPLTYTGPDGVLREVPVGSAGCQTLNCVIKCSGPAYLNNKAYCEKALSDTSRSMYTDAFGGVVSPVVPRPRRR